MGMKSINDLEIYREAMRLGEAVWHWALGTRHWCLLPR